MATFTITTTKRNDEALAWKLAQVQSEGAPYQSVDAMVTGEFAKQVEALTADFGTAEKPTVAELFNTADDKTREEVRKLLKVPTP